MRSITWLSFFVLTACGAKKAVEQTVKEPQLMKTWETSCSSSSLLNMSTKSFIQFTGDQFKEVNTYYESAGCGTRAAEVTYEGTFDVGAKLADDKKAIDFKYQKVSGVSLTEKGKKAFERVALCGHKSWEVGKVVDLTDSSAGKTCPVQSTPSERYDIFKTEADKLYLGKGGVGSRAKQSSERPKELDANHPYQVSDHRI